MMNSFVSHNDLLPGEIIILKLIWPQNQSSFNCIYFELLISLLETEGCLYFCGFFFFFANYKELFDICQQNGVCVACPLSVSSLVLSIIGPYLESLTSQHLLLPLYH
jgi:hypothetical protein